LQVVGGVDDAVAVEIQEGLIAAAGDYLGSSGFAVGQKIGEDS